MAKNQTRLAAQSAALSEQLSIASDDVRVTCQVILGLARQEKGPSISNVLVKLDAGAVVPLTEATAVQLALLASVAGALHDSAELRPPAELAASRLLGEILTERHGGRTIELRVPPVLAVQLASSAGGPRHTRGTPPNVAEVSVRTFVELAFGIQSWSTARSSYAVHASGSHVDELDLFLPVTTWAAIDRVRTE